MASLASFLPRLAPLVERSTAALYERQRALVRMGLLPKAVGRGRISGGATATPKSVAWLLVSLLATEHLSEVPHHTGLLANAELMDDLPAPFPTDGSFVEVIAHVLADPAVAARITYFEAMRGLPFASMGWIHGEGVDASNNVANFGTEGEWEVPKIATRALVSADVIQSVANLLSERD